MTDDRGFKVGDYLALNEYDGAKYTGRAIIEHVDYIMDPNDCMTCQGGYVLMGIRIIMNVHELQEEPLIYTIGRKDENDGC